MARELLNTEKASKYVGLSQSTLEKLRVYGGGPVFVKARRCVRYSSEDLDDWLHERRVVCTAQLPNVDRAGARANHRLGNG